MRKINWRATDRAIRILYALFAFATALAMRLASGPMAMAQDEPAAYKEQSALYDRLDKIETRLDDQDSRSEQMEGEINHMEGIGEGGMTALGVLQLIGLIKKYKGDDN